MDRRIRIGESGCRSTLATFFFCRRGGAQIPTQSEYPDSGSGIKSTCHLERRDRVLCHLLSQNPQSFFFIPYALTTGAEVLLRAPISAATSSSASSFSRAAAICIPPGWQGIVTAGTPARLKGVV